jgi:hypothetical protein
MSDTPERDPGIPSAPAPVRAGGGDDVAEPGESAEAPSEFKPTPARVMAAAEGEGPGVEPTVEEACIDVEGAPWSIRVLGRAGGSGASAVPVLLLGFWPGSEPEGDPRLERVVAGRFLETMSESDLREALSGARPWQPPSKAPKRTERERRDRRDGATRRRQT